MANQEHTGSGDNINIEGDFYYGIRTHPTILADIINELGRSLDRLDSGDEQFSEFSINSKIKYNNVIKFQDIIKDRAVFQGKLSVIYKEFDSQGSTKKLGIFSKIRSSYKRAKGELLKQNPNISEINLVRKNADSLIESVENDLKEIINKSNNVNAPLEVIDLGLEIVLVDAFIRCKILEPPQ